MAKKEIIYHSEPLVEVTLSEEEIIEEQIFETLITSQELLTEGIQSVTSAQETKTAFTKIFTIEAVNAAGEKYIIKTEKTEDGETVIVDKVKVPVELVK